jgi:hypothetical protein
MKARQVAHAALATAKFAGKAFLAFGDASHAVAMVSHDVDNKVLGFTAKVAAKTAKFSLKTAFNLTRKGFKAVHAKYGTSAMVYGALAVAFTGAAAPFVASLPIVDFVLATLFGAATTKTIQEAKVAAKNYKQHKNAPQA